MNWCRFAVLVLFLVQSTSSWSAPLFCRKLMGGRDYTVEEKIQILQSAGQNFSKGLFQSDELLAYPQKFKSFLKKVSKTSFNKLDDKDIEKLVNKYLAGILSDYHGLIVATKEKKLYPLAPLSVLSRHYSEQLKIALQTEGLFKIKDKSKWGRFVENRANILKSTAFVAIWTVFKMSADMIAPAYLPGLKPGPLTAEQKQILFEQVPNLTPQEAISLIEKELPGVKGFNVYQTIQRAYLRLSLVQMAGAMFLSPLSLHYLTEYTPVGAPLTVVKKEFDFRWDMLFTSRDEMRLQVMTIKATQEGLDTSDKAAFLRLQNEVQKMTDAELHEFLHPSEIK